MITSDIKIIRERLLEGDVIGLPTETVYGLAANVFNSSAVKRIFETKQRPTTNPLIDHVASISQARALVKNFPEKALLLAKEFWPGPMTLILPSKLALVTAAVSILPLIAIIPRSERVTHSRQPMIFESLFTSLSMDQL